MKSQFYRSLYKKTAFVLFGFSLQILVSCAEKFERDNPFDPQLQAQMRLK